MSYLHTIWSGTMMDYVFGFSESHGRVVKFRVDRVYRPALLDRPYRKKPEGYDLSEYCRQVFSMYDGRFCTVGLKCENARMKDIIDRFGEDVETTSLDSGHFVAAVEVSVSPTFYAWIFTYGASIQILSPDNVREEYADLLKAALQQAE